MEQLTTSTKRKILSIALRHLLTKGQFKSYLFKVIFSIMCKSLFDLSVALENISELQFVKIQKMSFRFSAGIEIHYL